MHACARCISGLQPHRRDFFRACAAAGCLAAVSCARNGEKMTDLAHRAVTDLPYLEVKGSHREIGQAIGEAFREQIRAKVTNTAELNLQSQRIRGNLADLYSGLHGVSRRNFPL